MRFYEAHDLEEVEFEIDYLTMEQFFLEVDFDCLMTNTALSVHFEILNLGAPTLQHHIATHEWKYVPLGTFGTRKLTTCHVAFA